MWWPGSYPYCSSFRALQKKWVRWPVSLLHISRSFPCCYNYLIILYLAIRDFLYTLLRSSAVRRAKCVKILFKESGSLRAPTTAQLILSLCTGQLTWQADLWTLTGNSAAWTAWPQLDSKGRAAYMWRKTHPREAWGPDEPCTTNKLNAHICSDLLFHFRSNTTVPALLIGLLRDKTWNGSEILQGQ